MRQLLTSGLLVLALLPIERAAAVDFGRPPLPFRQVPAGLDDWSGIYVGIIGAGASGSSRFDFVPAGASTDRFDLAGGLLGVTVGYNGQLGPVVFGLEGDVSWARITGAINCPGGGAQCETNNSQFSTLRGRLGYSFGGWLPYVTGGFAAGHLEANIPTVGSNTVLRAGWTVGGGVEYALANNVVPNLPGRLSAKAEYLYVHLGKFDCGFNCGVPPINVRFEAHLVRGGLNYRF